MNKSKIALSVVIALAVTWTGGTYYTGTQLEKNHQQYVEITNQQIKKELVNFIKYQQVDDKVNTEILQNLREVSEQLKIEIVGKFERSFLSSKASYNVYSTKNPEQKFSFDAVIEHGPLPLSSLTRFNFAPKPAIVTLTLARSEQTEPLFQLANNKTPLLITVTPDYLGGYSSITTLNPLNSKWLKENADGEFQFEGGELTFSSDEKNLSSSAKFSKFQVINNDMNFSMDLMDYDISIDKSDYEKFKRPTSKQYFNVSGISAKFKLTPLSLAIGSIDTDADINSTSEYTSQNARLNVNNILINNKDFGSLKLQMDFSKVDFTALQNMALSAESFESMSTSQVMELMSSSLKTNPVLTISPLSWTNPAGKSTFNGSIELQAPQQHLIDSFNGLNDVKSQIVLASLKNANLELSLSEAMMVDVTTKYLEIEGNSEEQAKQGATLQVAMLTGIATSQKVLVKNENEGTFTSHFSYTNGAFDYNGQKGTAQEALAK